VTVRWAMAAVLSNVSRSKERSLGIGKEEVMLG
jgi:hypothetical protein